MIRSASQAPVSKKPVKEDQAVQLTVIRVSCSLPSPLNFSGHLLLASCWLEPLGHRRHQAEGST